ncbi:MAG: porphobilinogen synthase [Fibrobacterales bacterium]
MIIPTRMRRNRVNAAVRSMFQETSLSVKDFILPLFIMEGSGKRESIDAMPGCFRFSVDELLKYLKEIASLGIPAIALFPAVPEDKKNSTADESYSSNGLVPTAIKAVKDAFPGLIVITDVALDPYNSDGHDGIVSSEGIILNDETVDVLCKQALMHAESGADIISPSDMMDGRIGALRSTLDGDGFTQTGIMSYAAKYCSAFYGPFRDALDSAPKAGDKKTYQMNPANKREALREVELDIAEGADSIIVKPALSYLDIIHVVKETFDIPVAAYNVSGEYSMVCAAAEKGWLDRESTMMESLLSIKRAGADVIWTYFAVDAAKVLER